MLIHSTILPSLLFQDSEAAWYNKWICLKFSALLTVSWHWILDTSPMGSLPLTTYKPLMAINSPSLQKGHLPCFRITLYWYLCLTIVNAQESNNFVSELPREQRLLLNSEDSSDSRSSQVSHSIASPSIIKPKHNTRSSLQKGESYKTSAADSSSRLNTSKRLNKRAAKASNNGLAGRARCIADKPDEPKNFYYGNQALTISIFTTDRITHKLTSTILKIFAEEVLGYSDVTLHQLEDPKQGFDPDIQFSYISSCTDIRWMRL